MPVIILRYVFATVMIPRSRREAPGTSVSSRNSPVASRCARRHSASNLSWSRWYCALRKIKKKNNKKNIAKHSAWWVRTPRRWELVKRRRRKQSSPAGGAPALPATSLAACDPPRGPTTSWARRSWGMAPGAGNVESDVIKVHKHTHSVLIDSSRTEPWADVLTYTGYRRLWTACGKTIKKGKKKTT